MLQLKWHTDERYKQPKLEFDGVTHGNHYSSYILNIVNINFVNSQ